MCPHQTSCKSWEVKVWHICIMYGFSGRTPGQYDRLLDWTLSCSAGRWRSRKSWCMKGRRIESMLSIQGPPLHCLSFIAFIDTMLRHYTTINSGMAAESYNGKQMESCFLWSCFFVQKWKFKRTIVSGCRHSVFVSSLNFQIWLCGGNNLKLDSNRQWSFAPSHCLIYFHTHGNKTKAKLDHTDEKNKVVVFATAHLQAKAEFQSFPQEHAAV